MRNFLLSVLMVLVGVSGVTAQPVVRIVSEGGSDTLSSNGDSFTVAVGGMASLRVQTLDSYSGTWEVQCSLDGGTTFDEDDEVNLSLEGASAAAVQSVTDTVGIWTAGIAGCTHVRLMATAGFAASDTVMAVRAVASGGAGGGGGSVSCTNCATDATHDSAASATGPQVMGSGKNTTLPTAVTDGDAVRLLTDLYGRLQPKNVCQNPDLVTSVVISTATAGNVQLVALSGSTVVTVCGFNVVATGTVAVQLVSGTGAACATGETDRTGAMPFVANGGINTGFGDKIFSAAAGEAVCVELSAAIQIDGVLTYVQQ